MNHHKKVKERSNLNQEKDANRVRLVHLIRGSKGRGDLLADK